MEQAQVNIPVDWDKFCAYSEYRHSVFDQCMSPQVYEWGTCVQNEVALVEAFTSAMATMHGLNAHEAFRLWERWARQYWMVVEDLLLARIEDKPNHA